MKADSAYGLWAFVAIDSVIVLLFAKSFFHPASRRDWKAMGAFSAFIVALFSEMYGFPLTIYLLSGWLGNRFPGLNLSHNSGHLLNDLIGWKGDAHVSPFHLASYGLIIAGFWLIAAAWRVLHEAVGKGRLAKRGPYARIRHPQYAGFLLVMVGFLFQWPTLLTLVMFPALVLVYRRLAMNEERDVSERFGAAWERYAAVTPRFVPRLRRSSGTAAGLRPPAGVPSRSSEGPR
jgi:protein-S-isoprenylcysteine O-methyltransferase Ste14